MGCAICTEVLETPKSGTEELLILLLATGIVPIVADTPDDDDSVGVARCMDRLDRRAGDAAATDTVAIGIRTSVRRDCIVRCIPDGVRFRTGV